MPYSIGKLLSRQLSFRVLWISVMPSSTALQRFAIRLLRVSRDSILLGFTRSFDFAGLHFRTTHGLHGPDLKMTLFFRKRPSAIRQISVTQNSSVLPRSTGRKVLIHFLFQTLNSQWLPTSRKRVFVHLCAWITWRSFKQGRSRGVGTRSAPLVTAP